jgi:hypothetical protein
VSAALEVPLLLQTGLAALLFAAIFAFGGGVHPLRSVVRDRRSIVSFSAGMSAAYVFVHLMPELHGARVAFTESASMHLRYEGLAIYVLALLGFLGFYGLDHLKLRVRLPHAHADAAQQASTEHTRERRAFWTHIGGFAAYVALMSYLLVRNLEGETGPVALFALAIGAHFLTVEHALREEHGAEFMRIGRWLLAAMSLLGWAVGVLLPIPASLLALLVAFISGAVIMNSAVMELPTEKDGRFLPFLAGGLLYALALLPLG